jgi:hypothetical protein
MPTHPEHHGTAYHRRGHHEVVVDAIGHRYRPGAATFVEVSYEWKGGKGKGSVVTGAAPSRLYRMFHPPHNPDEEDPPLLFEHAWLWDFESIVAILRHDEHIDAGTLEYLRTQAGGGQRHGSQTPLGRGVEKKSDGRKEWRYVPAPDATKCPVPRASQRPPPALRFAPPRRKPTARTPLAARTHGPTPCKCMHSLHTRILQHTPPTPPHTPTPTMRAQTMHACSPHTTHSCPPPPAAPMTAPARCTARHTQADITRTCAPYTCMQRDHPRVPRPALA